MRATCPAHLILSYRWVTLLKMTVFWDVVPCCLVEVYRRFRRACCLHQQGDDSSPWWWRQQTPLKLRQTSTTPHGATSRRHLHTRCSENLKPHRVTLCFIWYLLFWVKIRNMAPAAFFCRHTDSYFWIAYRPERSAMTKTQKGYRLDTLHEAVCWITATYTIASTQLN
jgi:hypothetical protein